MSVSILECLQNAQYNLVEAKMPMQKQIGANQLDNAIKLLSKGYSIEDEVEPLIEQYGSIEEVPEKELS